MITLCDLCADTFVEHNKVKPISQVIDSTEFSGDIIYDYSHVNGNNNESLSRVLVSLNGQVDLSSVWIKGSELHAGVAVQRGDAAEFLEDVQAFNNIDAEDIGKLYQFYLAFTPTEHGRLKLGRQDANDDFASPDFTGDFINSSMGFSPTVPLPSYPTPTLAAVYLQEFNQSWTLNLGVFESAEHNSTFDEQFYIAQVNTSLSAALQVKLGYWHDTAINDQNGYGIVEYTMAPHQSFSVQYGQADPERVGVSEHLGLSYQHQQLFSHKDKFGLGYTRVGVGSLSETALEVYYGYELSQTLTLVADLQRLSTLGLDNAPEDAVLATLRFHLTL